MYFNQGAYHVFITTNPTSSKITSSPPQQLPPGRPVRDAIDFELDEMRRNRQY